MRPNMCTFGPLTTLAGLASMLVSIACLDNQGLDVTAAQGSGDDAALGDAPGPGDTAIAPDARPPVTDAAVAADAPPDKMDASPPDVVRIDVPSRDARPIDLGPTACNTVLNTAVTAIIEIDPGPPPPSLVPPGGPVLDGAYALTTVRFFNVTPDLAVLLAGVRLRWALHLSGGSLLESVVQSQFQAQTTEERVSSTFRTQGLFFFSTDFCPGSAPEDRQRYSSTGTTLRLLFEDADFPALATFERR